MLEKLDGWFTPGKLILASESPRRRDLLANAGFEFEVRPSGVEEVPARGETPMDYVRRLARAKAFGVEADPQTTVLAADTVVVVDGQILEKPVGVDDARRMLRLLSGRDHTVITGVCLRRGVRCRVESESTRVCFSPLTDGEIEAYVSSGEPLDKAGAYAIQGLASRFVHRIEGCYFNVVGLPVSLVYRMLRAAEQEIWG